MRRIALLSALLLAACGEDRAAPKRGDQPPRCAGALGEAPGPDARCFAVIGDYGDGSPNSLAVAALVTGWAPDFIITTGDNSYPHAGLAYLDLNVGRPYHAFIGNYRGAHGPGSAVNRFWPALGNHDWGTGELGTWYAFFTLPNNERYYDFREGAVHVFALDSDPHEPDGIDVASRQAAWLRPRLAASDACHRLVVLHHPPYTSGFRHGPSRPVRWPFKAWGATAVLSGHEHIYERLEVDGIPYFVNGIGGRSLYLLGGAVPESRARYNAQFGAMRVLATPESMTFELWDLDGQRVDTHRVDCP